MITSSKANAYFVFLLICFSSTSTFGQNDVGDAFGMEVKYSNRFLNIDYASIAAGDLALSYEHRVDDKLVIEYGMGVLLPWHMPSLAELGDGNSLLFEKKIRGVSWMLAQKYMWPIFKDNGLEWQFAFLIRQRIFRVRSANLLINRYSIRYTDFVFGYGFRKHVGRKLLFQWHLGCGLQFEAEAEDGSKFIIDEQGRGVVNAYLNLQIGLKL